MAEKNPYFKHKDNLLVIVFFSSVGGGNFTFTLKVYNDPAHNIDVPNPVALDQTLYFEVMVETQSAAPNLDLFLEKCWSSKSNDAQSMDGKFELIEKG